jgi:nucleotide-binding universal stress UspA family protein
MKILIPTDFSVLSKVAINFAIQLGRKFNAELILFHVVYQQGPGRGSLKAKDLEQILINDARNECAQLIEDSKSLHPQIGYEVIPGYPVNQVVNNYANNHGIDLIIMGTKGATGLKKIFLGSNAASVMNKSKIPVIAVPEFAKFSGLSDIVYATDILNLRSEIERVISFARNFKARVHILHVTSPREEMVIDAKDMVAQLIDRMNYPHISFAVSHANDPEEGIDEYIAKNKIDMLVMFTHELTFFEKLFGKGITRQVALFNKVPLITFKKIHR